MTTMPDPEDDPFAIGKECTVLHRGEPTTGRIQQVFRNGLYQIYLNDGTGTLKVPPWKILGPNGEQIYFDEDDDEVEVAAPPPQKTTSNKRKQQQQTSKSTAKTSTKATSKPSTKATSKHSAANAKRTTKQKKQDLTKGKKRPKPSSSKSSKASDAKRRRVSSSAQVAETSPSEDAPQTSFPWSPCAICHDDNSESRDRLLKCQSCGLCVHEFCFYGKRQRSRRWSCDLCKQRVDVPKCELCPEQCNRALKQTAEGRWAHVTCAIWTKGVSFRTPQFRDIIVGCPRVIKAKSFSRPCSLCDNDMAPRTGIRCYFPGCTVGFHVSCAFDSQDIHLAVYDDSEVETLRRDLVQCTQVRDDMAHLAFCEAHTRELCVDQDIHRSDLSNIPKPAALFSSDEENDDEDPHSGGETAFSDDEDGKLKGLVAESSTRRVSSRTTSRHFDGPTPARSSRASPRIRDLHAPVVASFGGAADYFNDRHSKSVQVTRHLKSIDAMIPDEQVREDIMRRLKPKHRDHLARLREIHRSKFKSWWWQMQNGFNVLLYGFGSKSELLNDFTKSIRVLANSLQLQTRRLLSHSNKTSGVDGKQLPSIMVLKGHAPNTSAKDFVAAIIDSWIGIPANMKFTSVDAQCEFVLNVTRDNDNAGDGFGPGGVGAQSSFVGLQKKRVWAKSRGSSINSAPFRHRDLVIVVHNIDGPDLRQNAWQTALSTLAQSPRIHLIASVDHVHATLMWDQNHLEQFNWLWQDATTYRRYDMETKYAAPVLGVGDKASSRGTSYVLQSLTRNHVEVLALLARHQLAGKAHASSRGMEFSEFYSSLRDDMVVSNDRVLRQLLVELKDHEFVASRQLEGKEYIYICLPEQSIKEILEFAYSSNG